jgi:hypothetical protein
MALFGLGWPNFRFCSVCFLHVLLKVWISVLPWLLTIRNCTILVSGTLNNKWLGWVQLLACGIKFHNVNLVAFSCGQFCTHLFCCLPGMIALAVQRVREHNDVIMLLVLGSWFCLGRRSVTPYHSWSFLARNSSRSIENIERNGMPRVVLARICGNRTRPRRVGEIGLILRFSYTFQ